MIRTINDHKVNSANDKIEITVLDEPGAGGANHEYEISFHDASGLTSLQINFQNGPIAEVGINGLTQEVLIAICIDRLCSFQDGPYACMENGRALRHLEIALEYLHARTRSRMARGVEGTHAK